MRSGQEVDPSSKNVALVYPGVQPYVNGTESFIQGEVKLSRSFARVPRGRTQWGRRMEHSDMKEGCSHSDSNLATYCFGLGQCSKTWAMAALTDTPSLQGALGLSWSLCALQHTNDNTVFRA